MWILIIVLLFLFLGRNSAGTGVGNSPLQNFLGLFSGGTVPVSTPSSAAGLPPTGITIGPKYPTPWTGSGFFGSPIMRIPTIPATGVTPPKPAPTYKFWDSPSFGSLVTLRYGGSRVELL